MFNKEEFEREITETLKKFEDFGFYSKAAVQLLMGTCAQESTFGTHVKQLGGGPALSVFQIEPNTEKDCWLNWLKYKPAIARRIEEVTGVSGPNSDALLNNREYAIIICRIKYMRVPKKLPIEDDIEGMARYWKQWYNTPLGAGTVQEFIENYKRYVNNENRR